MKNIFFRTLIALFLCASFQVEAQSQFLQKVKLVSGDSVAINFSEVRYASANGSGAVIAYGKPVSTYYTSSSLSSIVSASCGNLVSLTEYGSGGSTIVVAINPKYVKSSSSAGSEKTRLYMDGSPSVRIVSGSFDYVSSLLGECMGGGGSGTGTVTSVGITAPEEVFDVSGSPVTTSGDIDITFLNQDPNTIFSGPASGSPGQPGFRSMVTADIPDGGVTMAKIAQDGATIGQAPIWDGANWVPTDVSGGTGLANQGVTMNGDTTQLGSAYNQLDPIVANIIMPDNAADGRWITAKKNDFGWSGIGFQNIADFNDGLMLMAASDSANAQSIINGNTGNGSLLGLGNDQSHWICWDSTGSGSYINNYKNYIGLNIYTPVDQNVFDISEDSTLVLKRIEYAAILDTSLFTENSLPNIKWIRAHSGGSGTASQGVTKVGSDAQLGTAYSIGDPLPVGITTERIIHTAEAGGRNSAILFGSNTNDNSGSIWIGVATDSSNLSQLILGNPANGVFQSVNPYSSDIYAFDPTGNVTNQRINAADGFYEYSAFGGKTSTIGGSVGETVTGNYLSTAGLYQFSTTGTFDILADSPIGIAGDNTVTITGNTNISLATASGPIVVNSADTLGLKAINRVTLETADPNGDIHINALDSVYTNAAAIAEYASGNIGMLADGDIHRTATGDIRDVSIGSDIHRLADANIMDTAAYIILSSTAGTTKVEVNQGNSADVRLASGDDIQATAGDDIRLTSTDRTTINSAGYLEIHTGDDFYIHTDATTGGSGFIETWGDFGITTDTGVMYINIQPDLANTKYLTISSNRTIIADNGMNPLSLAESPALLNLGSQTGPNFDENSGLRLLSDTTSSGGSLSSYNSPTQVFITNARDSTEDDNTQFEYSIGAQSVGGLFPSAKLAIKSSTDNGTWNERMTIDNFGFIGVNDTTPTQRLDVNGNIATEKIYGRSATPGVTATGTGASATITGTDVGFIVDYVTGGTPITSGTMFAIVFSSAYGSAPVISFSAGDTNVNSNQARKIAPDCAPNQVSGNGFNFVYDPNLSLVLSASTHYVFNFITVGK